MASPSVNVNLEVTGPVNDAYREILSTEALAFLASLAKQFEPRRLQLLERRQGRQTELDSGKLPDFLPETAAIRKGDWTVAPIPKDLEDRRVEITGPVDRKMIINALNSGANVFMADFEDSNSPTWQNNLEGQINLRDAVRGAISYTSPEGKQYRLNQKHRHCSWCARAAGTWSRSMFCVDGKPISASLFDFGLYFFHNASQADRPTAPARTSTCRSLKSHLEARLWNDVFLFAQDALGVPSGHHPRHRADRDDPRRLRDGRDSVRTARPLRRTELRPLGLHLQLHQEVHATIRSSCCPTAPRSPWTAHFLKSYVDLLIQTCHRRGIHAMGGMAAQIPIKNDPQANEAALEKVRQDKLREVKAGHDGTWVAHPGLVPIAKEIFDQLHDDAQPDRT